MNSMYRRQLAMMVGMIFLSFALLGAGFFTLSYRYNLDTIQSNVERYAGYISRYAEAVLEQGYGLRSEVFASYISSVATISDTTVLLCDTDGEILYAAGTGASDALVGAQVPNWISSQVQSKGSYAGVTNLSGIFQKNVYLTGVPITAQSLLFVPDGVQTQELTYGVIFVAKDASSVMSFLRETFNLFFMTAMVVLVVAIFICSATSQKLSQPIRDMAAIAYKFAHGEMTARAKEDYTKRKDEIGELALAFNTMADTLAKAEAQRSEFVANISHELKTPMTTIAGFIDGILDGTIPPDRAKASLEVVSSETRRLSRLVRRMLELSRLQSSERIAAQEQFDVSEVMLRVLVSLESKVNEKGLEIQTELPEGPLMVWGDPDAITQVCYNLLDNAIKFSRQGGILTIKMVSRGGKAYISVRNEGSTIPPEQLPYIFDRFHKADSSRSEHRDGVGLGLYIVKALLNTYKEDITVTSENGVTEFTFTLSEV